MRRCRCVAILVTLLVPTGVPADEGMWMPQQIPALGDELKGMGLELEPGSFADLTAFPMGAVVSLGGCSAAFVSPRGLIVTNHHCVLGALQYNSTPEKDLIATGFLARSPDDEPPALPTARVYVTTAIDDVTAEIAGSLDKGLSDLERAKTIDRRSKRMVRECERPGDLRCQVVSFFAGERYLRLTALKIRDVRLVYAPALGVGNFGDEEDNWMWPRHTGDFSFLRAYVGRDGEPAAYAPDNVPYAPKHHLKISTRDLDPDDLILLAGYPAKTSRLVTAGEVRDAQRYDLPEAIRYREMLLAILREMGRGDREVQIRNAVRVASLENYLKKYRGTLEAFERDRLLERKREDERRLEEHFGRDPAGARRHRAIRDELAGLLAERRRTRERDTLYEWLYRASPMLEQADLLHRMSVERAKDDDDDRDEDFQERDWPRNLGKIRRMQRQIEVRGDRAGLRAFILGTTRLPAGQRIEAVDRALAATGRTDVEARVDALLDRLYAGTKMADLDVRLEMFEWPTGKLLEDGDPMIGFAAALRDLGEAIEERDLAFEGAEQRLRPQWVAAIRALKRGRLAPDANGTLRVGFGRIEGYTPRDGVMYAPQTTIRGVLEKDIGARPFDSPAMLLRLAGEGRFGPYADPDLGTLPVAFISTVSVTNGHSGSPALNARGEIAGLAFDMNWEGVAADWVVNETYVRTIHVDARYMLWVMDAVDGAHHLLREMGLPVHFDGRPRGFEATAEDGKPRDRRAFGYNPGMEFSNRP